MSEEFYQLTMTSCTLDSQTVTGQSWVLTATGVALIRDLLGPPHTETVVDKDKLADAYKDMDPTILER